MWNHWESPQNHLKSAKKNHIENQWRFQIMLLENWKLQTPGVEYNVLVVDSACIPVGHEA